MKRFIFQKRSIIGHFIIVTIVVGATFFYNAKKPDSVEAQACITIRPVIQYGQSSGSLQANGGCGTRLVSLVLPGTGAPWIGLTGWNLEYDAAGPGDGDEHVDTVSINIQDPIFDNSNVSFSVRACLNDQNDDNWFRWTVRYVVVRWR